MAATIMFYHENRNEYNYKSRPLCEQIHRGSKDGTVFYDLSALYSHNRTSTREDERQIMNCLQSSNTVFLLVV